jgi:hypothetical protein
MFYYGICKLIYTKYFDVARKCFRFEMREIRRIDERQIKEIMDNEKPLRIPCIDKTDSY